MSISGTLDNHKSAASHATHIENRNKMGVWGAASFVVGNVVGSGLFITPTSIVRQTSSVGLALSIWFLSAVISVLGAYCYVELGTSIRRSGADFAYLCYVGWFPAAFAFMSTGCLLTYPATLAVQAQTFSEYLFQGLKIAILDKDLEYYGKMLTSFSLLWLLLYMNFLSIGTVVSRFQIAASMSKVVATSIIIGVGFYYLIVKGQTQNLEEPFKNSVWEPGLICVSFFSGLFSYDGWDILNFGIEEVKNPKRTMPLAVIVGMGFVTILYLATNISFFVVLTLDEMLSSNAVATTFGQKTMGYFQYTMPFCISILLIGSLNSTLFSASRYLYAGAREGHLPAFIAIVNKENDSPRCALFCNVVMAMMFSFAGNTDQLIGYLGFAQWIQRSLTMTALLYIRICFGLTNKPVHPERIQTPIILPVIFLIICFSLVVVTIVKEFRTAVIGLGFICVNFCLYYVFLWDKALLKCDSYRLGVRAINEKVAIVNQIVFNGVVDSMPTQEGAVQEFKELKRPTVVLKSMTDKVAPLGVDDVTSLKKQRF